MSRILLVSGALAALAFAAGCGGSPSGPGGGAITQEEAAALAPEYEEYALLMFDDIGAPAFSRAPDGGPSRASSTVNFTFSNDRVCRLGGFVTLEGSVAFTNDPDTRTGNRQFTATRIDNGCTFAARGGGGTLKITGAPGIALTSNQAWTNGVLGTRTNTSTGTFTWDRGGGDTGSCQVSLTSTWAPATRTATISGTFCGFQVSATRTR